MGNDGQKHTGFIILVCVYIETSSCHLKHDIDSLLTMGLANIINRGEKPEGSAFMAAFVAVFVAFGGILFGYDTGTISGVMAMPFVKKTFTDDGLEFTSEQTSLITSILSAGTFTGAISAPWASDTLGRRLGLILFCVVFSVGAILQTAATGRTLLIVGRVVAGLGVGGVSSIVPLYQSEVAPKWIRGAVVSIYQFAITIGLLLAAIVNNATKNKDNSASYRIPLGLQLLWAVILSGGLILLPETPRFWIKKGEYDKAADSLRRLRRLPVEHEAVQKELLEIQSSHDHEMQIGSATWAACFSPKGSQLKRMLTGIAIQALQQLTGINFIFYYGTEFFKKSNISNPFLIQMITNIVNVVMTIPGIMFVDRVGRRKLLLIGAIVMCSSEFIVAAVGTAIDNETSSKVLIAFTCTFIAGFAATWGPIAWVVIGEIFLYESEPRVLLYAPPPTGFSTLPLPLQPLPRRRGPWIGRSQDQGLLHLGRLQLPVHRLHLLLHLRDQGSYSGGGGPDVRRDQDCFSIPPVCAYHSSRCLRRARF